MKKLAQRAQMRRYLWRLAEVAALLVLVVLLGAVFVWTFTYILPFVMAGVFALLLLPLVRFLERRGVPRAMAVIIVMVGIVAVLAIASVFLVVAVAREATMWTDTISDQFGLIQGWLDQQISVGRALFGQLPPTVAAELQNTAASSVSSVEKAFSGFAAALIQSVTHLPESMFVVVIALVATYFMLVNRDRMFAGFLKLLPPGWSNKVPVVIDDMLRAFAGTIRVQVVLMLLSAVLGVIGMVILRIKYAVIIGILFGIAGMVPIVGSAIISVPWAVGALLVGDVPLALKVLLLQAAISLIRHAVEPKIIADSVGLDTLSTLFALYVGMKLLGVVGLFIGPIALIGIKSLFRIRLFVDFFPVPVETLAETSAPVAAAQADGHVRTAGRDAVDSSSNPHNSAAPPSEGRTDPSHGPLGTP